jgi:chemotaxis protein MotB
MSSSRRGSGRGRRRGGRRPAVEHENEERWLVSYADMVTLLLCLFMVLFSISSVNTSKFEALQRALQDAFSGKVLPGGKAVVESGTQQETESRPAPQPPIPAIQPIIKDELGGTTARAQAVASAAAQAAIEAARKEDEDFQKLKQQIDALARDRGLQAKVETVITRRGLVVRLLTDKVLFPTGRADLEPRAMRILAPLAGVLRSEVKHPISVEGHTDSRPITGGPYPSNWELSAARASSVVRVMIGKHIPPRRLEAVGHANLEPVATNATASGQSRNRRVEIVLLRLNAPPSGSIK